MLYDLAMSWLELCAQVPDALYLWAVFSPVWVPLWGAIALALWNERRGY